MRQCAETRLKNQEEIRLEAEKEKMRGNLLRAISHDIRTPLTSVIGYLKLLEEMPDISKEQQDKFIHVTLDKALRLEVLVN